MSDYMRQVAPYPTVLDEIVSDLKYRPGWRFALEDIERDPGSTGLTFTVISLGYDTYKPEQGETYRVRHHFPVPPATFNRESWLVWVRERLIAIETHECCEFMQVASKRPFAPQHGPGNDPYVVFTHGDDLQRRTRFDGTVAES